MKFIDDKLFRLARKKILCNETGRLNDFLYSLIEEKAMSLSPEDSLKFLFELENRIYNLEGRESVRYGSGTHSKHRHIKYHDFFIENIPENSRVLDVGCGNGTLTFDIAQKVAGISVYGIDIVPENIENAKKTHSRENISYFTGDALTDLPDEKFDIIVLSNVLEHIKDRNNFLKNLKERYDPLKFLIRVPVFERDWRVPLKKELGMDYRLDPTHHIEYIQEEFFEELETAGLKSIAHQTRWGEIWAEIEDKDR